MEDTFWLVPRFCGSRLFYVGIIYDALDDEVLAWSLTLDYADDLVFTWED